MKVALVTCFNAEWHLGRFPAAYIPLNLLCLAASLGEHGHQVEIIDQSLALTSGRVEEGPHFHKEIAKLIAQTSPDVVGFTTMCNSYPQTLTLARHSKAELPDAKIVLGGPQATAVDAATLRHFPWIDVIVRGEADKTFPALIDCWTTGQGAQDNLSGLTWRDAQGGIHRTDSQPLLDLNALPYPAYDLYPEVRSTKKLVPVEAGRGCPFACTFCSTNLFFSRRYRIKSPRRLIAEMKHLHDLYGCARFDLVHDMLTVDKAWVRDFSRLLIAGNYGFSWGCSARVDCVTPDLLEEMAAAGCFGIFFGIETGSERMQPVVKKKLHTTQVLPVLQQCADLKMNPTASFITGFPDETTEDAMSSLEMALDVLQLSPDTTVQMHLLAPLVGSPLYEAHKNNLLFDGHSSDISLFLLTDDEIETVKQYPEVFPSFYFIPTPNLNRELAKAISASLYTCAPLLLGLRKSGIDLAALFTEWVKWQRAYVTAENIGQDYYLYQFRFDFVRFLREDIIPALENAAPVASMVEYYAMQFGMEKGEIEQQLVFRRFELNVDHLNRLVRSKQTSWEGLERGSWDLLYINLGGDQRSGTMYLEVPVTSQSIEPDDELEIPEMRTQLLTQQKLVIHNRTKKRLLLVEHHLDSQMIEFLGLQAQKGCSKRI